MMFTKIIYTGWFMVQLLSSTIFNFSITTIEGDERALSLYQPKKILIVTLPMIQNSGADQMLFSLDSLADARKDEMMIIGVPSVEDGYNETTKTGLQQWYRSLLSSKVIISEGLYTRKTSGSQQHPLFRWLTDATENEIYNIDIDAPGFKFLTNNAGNISAVLKPGTKISSRTLNNLLDQ